MGYQPVIGVAVLGSTGSVGTQTLDVLAGLGDRIRLVGLSAGRNSSLLSQQIAEWRPRLVASEDRDTVDAGAARWATQEEIATDPDVDVVVVGTAGKAGLGPTIAGLKAGKGVALANKEVLVMAGGIVRAALATGGGSLRPVDSEHSAVWQCLWGEEPEHVDRIILTASGGALRDLPAEKLPHVSPEEVLRHPTWNMGRKITIDSATLLNKGLETIEARWLFDVPLERIDVVMHRESIVHSLVAFTDGSVKAQLGLPDMRLPIQCALTYPERLPVRGSRALDLAAAGTLHFEPIDFDRLPCLRLAMEAGKEGGTCPAVMAAADEIAVERFLDGRIGFMEIPRIIEDTLSAHTRGSADDLDEVLEADRWARAYAAEAAERAAGGSAIAPVR